MSKRSESTTTTTTTTTTTLTTTTTPTTTDHGVLAVVYHPCEEAEVRRRALTLSRLKEEASKELRALAREKGKEALSAAIPLLAERLAPREEEALLSLTRHTPQLGKGDDVRASVREALVRALELERRTIERLGETYLEEMDGKPG